MAGKRISPKKRHWAPFVVILAVAALVATIGGTMAWLTDDTDGGITNTFTPAQMKIVIHENGGVGNSKFDGIEKNNVHVENQSQADVYIRAAIVINWQDDEGNIVAEPVKDSDYTMVLGTGWKESNGYYYCQQADVNNPAKTAQLIVSCVPNGTPKYHLSVSVLAQAIQAEPDEAVVDAWGDGLPTLAIIKAGN